MIPFLSLKRKESDESKCPQQLLSIVGKWTV
jgi:hypothetical protein